MSLSRDDTLSAYAKHRELHHAGRWPELADLFALDARYCDPFFGEIQGRESIRAFLVRSMAGLEEWTFPIAWTAVDEGRVVTQWHNRLPGQRRDGSYFEFLGMSTIHYNNAGEIVSQLDLYDRANALQVIAEGRSRVVEHALAGAAVAGRPLVAAIHWLVSRTQDRHSQDRHSQDQHSQDQHSQDQHSQDQHS